MRHPIMQVDAVTISFEALKELLMYRCVTDVIEFEYKGKTVWLIKFGHANRSEYILLKAKPEVVTCIEFNYSKECEGYVRS